MNKLLKYKLFGIFAISDIIIAVAIIFIVFLGFRFIRIYSQNTVNQDYDKYIEYIVYSENVQPNSIEMVKIGDSIYRSENSKYLGTVTDVQYENYKKAVFDSKSGKYKEYEVPNKYNLFIKIKGNCKDNDRRILVENVTIKVGMNINVKGKGYAFQSIVTELFLD